jgi:hypothetical protein
MTYPNLVIAGAPRCGTSSLFQWLADHPDVCASRTKETRYLLDADSPIIDRRRSYHAHGLAGYEALFKHCAARRPGPRVVMEATPDYLYQSTAPEVLAALRPQPLVAFLLRRPSERVYSHYRFARNNMALLGGRMTFRQFVDANRAGPGGALDGVRNLRHAIAYSRYASFLSAWAQMFDPGSIRVYLLERMRTDAIGFMRSVAADAGLDPSFYDSYAFPRVNESAEVRWQWLERARPAVARVVPGGIVKRAARRIHGTVNTRAATSGPTDEDRTVLRELDAEFASDNARLASMFSLDLESWA